MNNLSVDFMFEFIKEQALRKAQESKKKIGSGPGKSSLRPYSSTPYYSNTNRPISGISTKSKQTGISEMKMFTIFISSIYLLYKKDKLVILKKRVASL